MANISLDLNKIFDKIIGDQHGNLKVAMRKIKNAKTHLLKNTGTVSKLKFDLMNLVKKYNSQKAKTIELKSRTIDPATKVIQDIAKSHYTKIDAITKKFADKKIGKAARDYRISQEVKAYDKIVNAMNIRIESDIKSYQKLNIADKQIAEKIAMLKLQIKEAQKTRNTKILIGLGVGIAVISIIAIAIKLYTVYMKRAKSNCNKIKDPREKKVCEITTKINALQNQAIEIKKQSIQCEITDDPQKCNKRIDNEIDKIKSRIDILDTQLKVALSEV